MVYAGNLQITQQHSVGPDRSGYPVIVSQGLFIYSSLNLFCCYSPNATWISHTTGKQQHVCEKGRWPHMQHKSHWDTYGAPSAQCAYIHKQNKHGNPGLEELSDDTAACITAKTFTLLFYHNPFIFFIPFVYLLWLFFFFSLSAVAKSLVGYVLITDGGTATHSKGKRSQGHAPSKATFTIEMTRGNLEGNRCKTALYKERFTPIGWLFAGFFFTPPPPSSFSSLKKSSDWQQSSDCRGNERRGKQIEGFQEVSIVKNKYISRSFTRMGCDLNETSKAFIR